VSEIAALLLKKGVEVNAVDDNGRTALFLTAGKDASLPAGANKAVAEVLISNGADLNVTAFDKTPLQWAISNGQSDVADVLRKNGAK